jgi:hypothetical protein
MNESRWGTERHRTNGERLVGKVRELIREGNVRRIIIKNEEGRTLIEAPLAIGVVGALLAPAWAAIGAIAALVSDCSIEVERDRIHDAAGASDEAQPSGRTEARSRGPASPSAEKESVDEPT